MSTKKPDAKDLLGENIPDTISDEAADQIVDDIEMQNAAPKEYTAVSDDEPKKRKAKGMPKTKRIILEENDDIPPTGLYLGVNGKGYMIQPGVEVDVPEFLIEVLNNAVQSRPVFHPQTRQIIDWRDQMRYPYRVVGA